MGDALREVPRPALVIGIAGVIPFVAGALAMLFGSPAVAVNAYLQLIHYGAVVLGFVGAVHWGLAAAASMRGVAVAARWYLFAAAPVLVGWMALGLVDPTTKTLVLALGFFGAFMIDLRAVAQGLAPGWHKALRKPLTVIVLVALGGVVLWAVRYPRWAGGGG